MTISCSVCEPVATAQSLGDDRRVVVTRLQQAWEFGPHNECGPFGASGRRDWPIDRCSNQEPM